MNPLPAASARERFGILLSRLLGSGQWERALTAAGDWLAEEPEAPIAHRAAAQSLINLGRHKLATPHLQRVLAANPNDDFAWRLASIADFHQRRHDRAHANIQRAIQLRPQDAWHWFHLASMRYAGGGRRAALQCAQRALELAPNNADILNLIAICAPHGSSQQLARYQDALKLDPENVVIHHNVGVHFLHTEKDYTRAAEAFRQVLALSPTHPTARENLLLALRELDPVRRVFQWPERLFERYNRLSQAPGLRGALFALLVVPWFVLILLALYLPLAVFYLPLAGIYDVLLRHDLQAQAGMIGARRGGFLNFWHWPRRVRVGGLFIVYPIGWACLFAFVLRIIYFTFR